MWTDENRGRYDRDSLRYPRDLPPRSTIHHYFCRWRDDRTLDRLHEALYAQCRQRAERDATPSAAIIDSQSVKGAEKLGPASIRRATMAARRSRARSASIAFGAQAWSIRRAC